MTSRREEKDRRRAERLAAEQAASEQAHRRRMYSIVVGGILGVAAIAAVAAVALTGSGGGSSDNPKDLPAPKESYSGATSPPTQIETDLFKAADAAGCDLRNPAIEGRTHITPDQKVKYGTNPPTSGNHDPIPATDGVYSQAPTALQIRHFVHTLEHGRIEIQYAPSLAKRRVNQLGGLFNDDPYHMVMFPNRAMPYDVAVTAWGHVLGCKKVDDKMFDAIRDFRDRYRDQGPENVP